MTTNIQRCIDLHKSGLPLADIAATLGLKYSTVTAYICSARRQGRLDPPPEKRVEVRRRGTMLEVMRALSPETMKWLMSITPRGAKISHTVTAIINDAYEEK